MKDLRRTVHCARPRGYGEGSSSILFLPGQASLRHKVGAAYLFDDRAGEGGEEGEGFEVPPSGLEDTEAEATADPNKAQVHRDSALGFDDCRNLSCSPLFHTATAGAEHECNSLLHGAGSGGDICFGKDQQEPGTALRTEGGGGGGSHFPNLCSIHANKNSFSHPVQ